MYSSWEAGNQLAGKLDSIHCKKKVSGFPVPSRDVTDQLYLAGNNLNIADQGEFCQ
jgi:hypothetical protein